MIDRKALLNDLKQQVKAVETDLGRQVKALGDVGARLRAEYDQARKLGRTAATWTSWLDERVTQVAVAWVLGTVFVRFCEDNRLIPEPYLTGPDGDRRELAESRYDAYVESDEDPTYRGWLEKAFEELGAGQGGQLLFDRKHNPLFQIPLSHDGARELVEFWRGRDDSGALHHDFTDELNEDGSQGWDTRFLGDLYEHLSKTARDVYALRQTPEFVEEFILDRTMDPAVSEFGYEGLKMIDPTCGSGHFVLGAFHRLIRIWSERQAGKDVHERVRAALDSVHGVDLNPFAVAIARFRLLVAAMAASGVRTMEAAAHYEWPIHLAVGDSLIKSRQLELMLVGGEEDEDPLASFAYSTEDVHDHPDILRPGRYHVVVGNPPYITVKDKVLNALYRDLYKTCHLKYHLTAPFAERFFELALRGDAEGRGYGLVGQITGNGFVKREFGAKLIEDYFAHQVELTEVIDTSGAHIPGHGTPTIIIIGRRRSGGSRSQTLRSVRSIQGEPSVPSEPKDGFVWKAIIEQIDSPGSISQWVAVDDLDRDRYFGRHPWVLVDGGLEMIEKLAEVTPRRLKSASEAIGYSVITGEDEAFSFPHPMASWVVDRVSPRKPFLIGDQIRDWSAKPDTDAIFPVNATPQQRNALEERHLWPSRQTLRTGLMFSKTKEQRGIHWSSFAFHKDERLEAQELICFSSIATTHNHFALVVEGAVPNHSAQVVMLRQPADTRAYVQLLGVLNSSVACCWLKMVSHNKGSGGIGGGIAEEHWEQFYEFTGSKLEEFPLPESYPVTLAAALEKHARQLGNSSPSATVAAGTPTVTTLREAQEFWHSTRARMIALQEELDWQVYSLYALHSEDLRVSENPDDLNIPDLALGERAFEIVLARRVAAGEASNEWFKRHNSTPITGIPAHWPAPYREVVQKRIEAIESNRAIGMVERSEYKRRWATEGWDALQEKALRTWLLERMENRDHWFDENGQPTILTLARLTDALSRDEDFVSVAKLYAPRKELAKVVAELITDEHVPFLSALRYKPSGLKKRADWEEVWDLQRKEDAAPDEPAKRKIRDSIPVPPKYTSADFLRPSYWRARGKLDVPKERFISYGQTNAATPELYGWAGWDHREQAQALATYFTNTALSTEEITPFLAGLLELQPWLSQWHNEFDMNYSGSPADFFAGYRQQKQGEHGLTDDDLRGWRPPAATRGRRAAVKP
ncbi:BREX-2 system adenine-specific DNA-methyltransferase PglX [Streptomyces luteogriseus]|uniref:BREX-2 system adenine-specific DNA-methyltransferase PglX n=1 Tax=Streptomyces luteogriseus TaxID=68233 RepID=UPI002E364B73|nr:BREX-2 system adenine-specific DNA-methyltransferase PglX [Streptomyces luteogriseus]WTJ30877.1 BREX-2 system adenine-specific DNA-methyltransferase PglX [Streptomyces luteogriseus]